MPLRPIPLALKTLTRTFPVLSRACQSRSVHLAPPYLLDEYIPRHQLLSSVDAAKKRSKAYAHLRNCNLCPRLCGVNRYEKTGYCLIPGETVKVNVIAPHFGEEPCIQGSRGSGSVFFSMCNLRCTFCQNHVRCIFLSGGLIPLAGHVERWLTIHTTGHFTPT